MADYILRDDAVQCANDLAEDFAGERLDSASYGAQAVAEWLKDIPAAAVVEKTEWDKLMFLVDAAHQILEATKWISVKERLPELYQNVLVHYYNPHCVEPHNFAVAYRQNGLDEFIPGKYIWHVDSSPLELDGTDVTHWMPLPEPPKEGGCMNGK